MQILPSAEGVAAVRVKRVHLYLNDREIDLANLPSKSDHRGDTTMSTDPSVQITRLRISMFRGIEELDVKVPPSGIVLSGDMALGKSSVLFAIRALLEGEGIGPDAIRFDAAKSTLLIDLVKDHEAKLAKRTITRDKTTLELMNGDGTAIPRAKEQLRALLGDRNLDPLKLYMSDAKERRRLILAACPVKVTSEDLNKWCGTSQEWNAEGHGQEVLARVRQMYFDKRTAAGQAVDQATAALALKQDEARRLRLDNSEPMTPEAARTHVSAAEKELAVLHDRRRQAAEREAAAEGTRTRVAELRAKAEELMSKPEAMGPTAEEAAKVDGELRTATIAFEEAKRRLENATAADKVLEARIKTAHDLEVEANAAVDQANELEQAIANSLDGDGDPIAMQVVAAEEALQIARDRVAAAEQSQKYRTAKQEVTAAEASKATANAEWERLNKIVKTLTEVAPAELSARADLIPGLEVTLTSITLDGKNIDMLSEGEKLQFCVQLSKRAASKAKILTVDGLEKLPPKRQPGFVRMALEGGFQLFATRVADGDLDIIDCYRLAEAMKRGMGKGNGQG